MPSSWLPLFLDIAGEPCLVVGAGKVAARKAAALLKAGASLTVVAPQCGREMHALLDAHAAAYRARRYVAGDLCGQRLVVAATDDAALNAAIATEARRQSMLVNVANPGHAGNAVIPAAIDRAPLQIALFSGGATPALMRQLQRQLEAFIPQRYGRLAAFAGELRERVGKLLPDVAKRREFWDDLLTGPAAEKLLAGDETGARHLAEQYIAGHGVERGRVDIVGAGPGDPELLTLHALRLLQQADVVVHDLPTTPGLLTLIPQDVERIGINRETCGQQEINRILVEQARQGRHVLRLRHGNPCASGEGREEFEALTTAGIACRLVSGTAADNGAQP